jgi:hypothetical protein
VYYGMPAMVLVVVDGTLKQAERLCICAGISVCTWQPFPALMSIVGCHTNLHGFILYIPAGLGMCSLFAHCQYIYLSGFPVSVGGNIMDHYFKCSLGKNVDEVNHHYVVMCGHLLYCMSTWTLPQCFSFVFCHAHGSLFVWNCDVGTWHYVHVVELRAE